MTPDLTSRARQLLVDIGLKEPSWNPPEIIAQYEQMVAFVADHLRQVAAEAREAVRQEILDDLPAATTKDLGVRVGMVIAARIVERGRRLTAREKMENLFRELDEAEPPK